MALFDGIEGSARMGRQDLIPVLTPTYWLTLDVTFLTLRARSSHAKHRVIIATFPYTGILRFHTSTVMSYYSVS